MMRKILFLSASIGLGHVKAAQAIIDELKRKNFHGEIRHIDVLSLMPDFLYKPLLKLYLWSLQIQPKLYGRLYSLSDRPASKARRILHYWLAWQLRRRLKGFMPECVVCTHLLGAGIMDSWNQRFFSLPYICCVTDFVIHGAWLYKSAAAYVVDNVLQIAKLTEQGISADKCYRWGIPFAGRQILSRSVSRQRLKIDAGRRIIFLFGGGCGVMLLDIRKLLPLDKNCMLVICCGLNRKLYDDLVHDDALALQCLILGYIDNVDEWLAAADIVITKAGGLSLCEILAAQRHCIIYRPLPGQEAQNAAYCRQQQWVEIAENEVNLKKIIDKIFRIASNDSIKRKKIASFNTESAVKIAALLDNKLYK